MVNTTGLVQCLCKILDGIADCLELVSHIIRDCNTEFLFNCIDQLICVEAVSTEILSEGCTRNNLRRVDRKLLSNQILNFFKNFSLC